MAGLRDPNLETRLSEWQHFYSWERPHDSPGGLTPTDRLRDRIRLAPTGEEIEAAYIPDREFILPRNLWSAPRPRAD